ncbi:MAG: tagaturonate reductase [Oscillospiraceae bacterium]|nr:tagaturonate reductase [Oscillospiraceae bacterium]MDD4414142.1 tagaturonate reductase [Oscillospiraceae bacterium]
MKLIDRISSKPARPERIIQFGEGGFLRGFFDWMLQRLCDGDEYNGSVVVVQPIEKGKIDILNRQNGLYTHFIRGVEGVESGIIDVISRCINPYQDYLGYLALADNPDFRIIVSNTTEAGIEYRPDDKPTDSPPKSFPAKLTALLYRRFQNGLNGFIILPCELIERNGGKLKEIVLNYASDWQLGGDFTEWINNQNHFCNTLVDRIVTGYPKDENLNLGYVDDMVNTSEYFHLWVIEGDKQLANELPFERVGLNVIWTHNLEPYRTRKVRILNGAHTAMVPYALLRGLDTVKSCMDNPEMLKFVKGCIYDEIIPTLDLPHEQLTEYAESVLKRFSNPYINHYLSSIALNSVSKFKVRVLPSILEYIKKTRKIPQNLIMSFGKLIKFYKTGLPNDSPDIISFMKSASVAQILANTTLWEQDLTFIKEEVSRYAD